METIVTKSPNAYELTSIAHGQKRSTLGEKYALFDTKAVLDIAADYGYFSSSAVQAKTKKEGYQFSAKHLVRLRNQNVKCSEGHPEIVISNSHAGNSSFSFFVGFHVFACLNGLISGQMFGDIRLRHSAANAATLEQSIRQTLDKVPALIDFVDRAKVTTWEQPQIAKFNDSVVELLKTRTGSVPVYGDLVRPHRIEQWAPTAWNVLNNVQENVIRGGFQYITPRGRRLTARGVQSANSDLRLNTAIWDRFEPVWNESIN